MRFSRVCLVTFLSGLAVRATIIATPEAPGVQTSSQMNIVTESFNFRPLGANPGFVSPVGTYSVGGAILADTDFGGAAQSNYLVVGEPSDDVVVTLTLNFRSEFFGMYWPAMDFQNQLEFYRGGVLIKTFTAADLEPLVNAAGYFGNPNPGPHKGAFPFERFAYWNFRSDNALTDFDQVVIRNVGQIILTGFESDNHSVSRLPRTVPEIPEPSTLAFLACSLVLLVLNREKLAA